MHSLFCSVILVILVATTSQEHVFNVSLEKKATLKENPKRESSPSGIESKTQTISTKLNLSRTTDKSRVSETNAMYLNHTNERTKCSFSTLNDSIRIYPKEDLKIKREVMNGRSLLSINTVNNKITHVGSERECVSSTDCYCHTCRRRIGRCSCKEREKRKNQTHFRTRTHHLSYRTGRKNHHSDRRRPGESGRLWRSTSLPENKVKFVTPSEQIEFLFKPRQEIKLKNTVQSQTSHNSKVEHQRSIEDKNGKVTLHRKEMGIELLGENITQQVCSTENLLYENFFPTSYSALRDSEHLHLVSSPVLEVSPPDGDMPVLLTPQTGIVQQLPDLSCHNQQKIHQLIFVTDRLR